MKYERILVIGDTQNEWGVSMKHHYYAGCAAREYDVDIVIDLGDTNDHPGTSTFDNDIPSSLLKRSIKKDYEIEYKAKEEFFKGLGNHSCRLVMLDGNHDIRPLKYAQRNPIVEDIVQQYEDYRSKLGWERVPYQKPICISGVWYCHMFVRTTAGRVSARSVRSGASSAKAQLQANLASCTAGHIPGFDYAELPTNSGRLAMSMITGSFYPNSQSYAGPQGNKHYQGIIFKEMLAPGEYDFEKLSLKRLKRWYG